MYVISPISNLTLSLLVLYLFRFVFHLSFSKLSLVFVFFISQIFKLHLIPALYFPFHPLWHDLAFSRWSFFSASLGSNLQSHHRQHFIMIITRIICDTLFSSIVVVLWYALSPIWHDHLPKNILFFQLAPKRVKRVILLFPFLFQWNVFFFVFEFARGFVQVKLFNLACNSQFRSSSKNIFFTGIIHIILSYLSWLVPSIISLLISVPLFDVLMTFFYLVSCSSLEYNFL